MIRLTREPRTRDELWLLIKALYGIEMPRTKVCPDHESPFEALAHAYFAESPNFAVWYASRGSGKSLALAVLGLVKAFVADADVTILGGSIWQSQNVRDHMSKLMLSPNAPRYAIAKDIQTELSTTTGRKIKPLPASQTSVRGPHPPLQLLDEVDEMEEKIYQAALGQAMQQINSRGQLIDEYIVASSTWQNPIGTFTNVIEDARRKGLPVFTWCWRELLEENGGWMSRRFIESKRAAVSAEMWRTEYELNEPSGASRAFDLDALEKYFVPYGPPVDMKTDKTENDEWWRWEDWEPGGLYAAGADWAKEQDKTVIAVIRYDVNPRRLVYLRRINRTKYDVMAHSFDEEVARYSAVALHDKTGVGNAVNDFLSLESARGFVMVGRERSQMFVDYIADFEHGGYRLPRNIEAFYKGHRGATTADVYAPHKWDSHTPDDLVAMALAHRAAGRIPQAIMAQGVARDETPRAADRQFHVTPEAGRSEGLVEVVDERYDGVFVPTFDEEQDGRDAGEWNFDFAVTGAGPENWSSPW